MIDFDRGTFDSTYFAVSLKKRNVSTILKDACLKKHSVKTRDFCRLMNSSHTRSLTVSTEYTQNIKICFAIFKSDHAVKPAAQADE